MQWRAKGSMQGTNSDGSGLKPPVTAVTTSHIPPPPVLTGTLTSNLIRATSFTGQVTETLIPTHLPPQPVTTGTLTTNSNSERVMGEDKAKGKNKVSEEVILEKGEQRIWNEEFYIKALSCIFLDRFHVDEAKIGVPISVVSKSPVDLDIKYSCVLMDPIQER